MRNDRKCGSRGGAATRCPGERMRTEITANKRGRRSRPRHMTTGLLPAQPSTPASRSTVAPSACNSLLRAPRSAGGADRRLQRQVALPERTMMSPSRRPALLRGAAFFDRYAPEPQFPSADRRTARHDGARNRLSRNPDKTPPDAPISQQPAGHELCGIDSDRKANSLRGQDRRRIHADHPPSGIH